MNKRQSIINLKLSASVYSKRQTLVYRVAIAVLVVAAGSVTLRAQREIRIPLHAYMPPDFPASINAVVPRPQYLPLGYELWRIYKDPADGFRTGKSEVEIEYRDPGCWTQKIRCSIELFVSPMTDKPFSGTAAGSPESHSFRIGNRTVQAQYFKSMGTDFQPGANVPPGMPGSVKSSNFNALVFPFGRFIIGIRGSKQGGADRSELIKVAESLTYNTR